MKAEEIIALFRKMTTDESLLCRGQEPDTWILEKAMSRVARVVADEFIQKDVQGKELKDRHGQPVRVTVAEIEKGMDDEG